MPVLGQFMIVIKLDGLRCSSIWIEDDLFSTGEGRAYSGCYLFGVTKVTRESLGCETFILERTPRKLYTSQWMCLTAMATGGLNPGLNQNSGLRYR